MLPNDPFMLLSVINTKLRDYGGDLDELCSSLDIDKYALVDKLSAAGFTYDSATNQFKA